ncbi:MAG: hypothetical protein ACPLRU_02210 [Desulfofundulus sp.]
MYRPQDIFVKVIALEPIFNGSIGEVVEDEGDRQNYTVQRKIKVYCRKDRQDEIMALPVVSGASVRGGSRRVFMQRVLDLCGIKVNGGSGKDGGTGQEVKTISRDVAYLLFAGGHTGSGESHSCTVEKWLKVYDDLPFFGLLGGSYKGVFFPGRLSVGFAYPVVKETASLFTMMGSPFNSDFVGLAEAGSAYRDRHRYTRRIVPELGEDPLREKLREMLEKKEYGEVRKALLTGGFEELRSVMRGEVLEEFAKVLGVPLPKPDGGAAAGGDVSGDAARSAVAAGDPGGPAVAGSVPEGAAGAVPPAVNEEEEQAVDEVYRRLKSVFKGESMIFAFIDPIPAGSVLHMRLSLLPGYGDDGLMEKAFHAFVETVLERGYLGGLHGRGYGACAMEARFRDGRPFADGSKANQFWKWVENNKDKILESLENFSSNLLAIDDATIAEHAGRGVRQRNNGARGRGRR